MSHNKHFTLFSTKPSPSGWYVHPFSYISPLYPSLFPAHHTFLHRKVAVILEELHLAYHTIFLDLSKDEQKQLEYTERYNPNGQIPALVDHQNGDFIVWLVLAALCKRY